MSFLYSTGTYIVLEAIQAGNTNVHSSQLTRYLQLLQVKFI